MSRQALDPEVAKRVSGLTLRARRTAEGLLSGIHRSPHRGASVVFVEHREYRPGDDPRLLDWRAYARTDRHSIKRFEQETQLAATLVLDRSASMRWRGFDGDVSKLEHAATLLAALAYVLIRQGDAAGLATISDAVDATLPARSRPAQLETLLRALADPGEGGDATDLRAALTQVAERSGRRGVVVLASDLLDLSEDALRPLGQLVQRGHDVLVLHVMHRDELGFPCHGPARFAGLEGEPELEADPDAVRESYLAEVARFVASCRARSLAAGARYALAPTDEPPEHTLASLLSGGRRGGWG